MSTDLSSPLDQPSPHAPVRKFLFERSFEGDLGLDFNEGVRPKPTFTEEQIEAARKEAFEQGRLEGEKAMKDSQMKDQNDLLSRLDEKLAALQKNAATQWSGQLSNLMDVALLIARKIVPVYAEKYGLGEIESIVSRVIAEMGREPRLVVRVAESRFDEINAKINEIVEQRAFEGKVVVLGEPSFGLSDCRVEWADGGIERDMDCLWQEIDKIMNGLQPTAQKEAATPSDQIPSDSINGSGEQA